jgi:hypothetical protein
MEEEVRRLGLADVIHFRDWMDREECARIVQQADLLLLLAQQQPAQIPNKLYEYLGTRAPILAFADKNGESAGMLDAVGGHVVITSEDPTDIREKVSLAVDMAVRGRFQINEARLAEWRTSAQMTLLMRVLSRNSGTAAGIGTPSSSD